MLFLSPIPHFISVKVIPSGQFIYLFLIIIQQKISNSYFPLSLKGQA
ncbi:hypothetical protein ACI8B_320007 [Acinetobacter proteolyticus]|uniref:Uncharacterized protein n=1 Tax=Acinetobacter proteolyticus TaxID=1776741 RepID=A0A653K826_9GAMM|nr:hypothetical protein ACI8B_320007 [Acinetobacter proteolyticus]